MKRFFMGVALAFAALSTGANAAACTNGSSNGFACSHIEFESHLTAAELGGSNEVLNDIWGWVDPDNGEEYAIIGMRNGTAFVRVHPDGTAEFLGRLEHSDGDANVASDAGATTAKAHDKTSGKSGDEFLHSSCHDELCGEEDSAWRDIKVYDHYAFIVSEAAGHGMQIFDLHELRNLSGDAPVNFAADAAQAYYAHYAAIGHAHNLFINEATARAYVVGHDRLSANIFGGLHILDITDPMNPVHIGEANEDGYTHDVQCVLYQGPDPDFDATDELCFASNEDSLTIWNVTDAANPVIVSRATYSQTGYTHQGWLSDDQRYFFLNDELDETITGSRTHLRVFNVADVNAPTLATDYYAPNLAIDHNNYVHGRWLYQSNYGAGLRILDVLDPENPVEAAYFDPQPDDSADFYGTWSNFRFPGGLVAFSDIYAGLYVVRPTMSEAGATPDLSVSVDMPSAEVTADDTVAGAFVVSNTTADASDVLVTAHLPSGATFAQFVAPQNWNCTDFDEGRVVECRTTLMAVNVNEEFTFTIDPESGGEVRAIVMAYALEADAAPGDNLDAATFTVASAPVSNSGGGGGGGVLLWLLFAMTGCVTASRLRSRHARR